MKKKALDCDEIELLPDAWERFEQAIKVVARAPPQHRKTKRGKSRPSNAKRSKEGGT
jgi:hypothetical protein